MSNQLKAGDQALIVGFRKDPINLGKSCELVAFLRPGERVDYQNGKSDGVVNIGTNPARLVSGDGIMSSAGIAGYALVQPKHLMPLRGDQVPEQKTEREVTY